MESNERPVHINNEREYECIQYTQHIDENTSTPNRTATQIQKMTINQKKCYKLGNVVFLNIQNKKSIKMSINHLLLLLRSRNPIRHRLDERILFFL